MKTKEQNQKEVMNYLEKSTYHLFMSEDGSEYQTIVKLGEGYAFVKNDVVYPIDLEKHLEYYPTEGRTKLKQRFHPTWNVNEQWYKGYGMGPRLKPRSVKYFKAMREKIADIMFRFKS